MKSWLHTKIVERLVLSLTLLGTLSITPKYSFDPINIPKFGFLVVAAMPLLFYVIPHFKGLPRALRIACIFFILWAFLSLAFHDNARAKQLYGEFGRNTGIITYLALTILMLAAALIATKHFAIKVSKVLSACGFLSTLYGFIQWLNLDPIEWSNSYGISVVGFFGNPNFMSSFLGIYSVFLLHELAFSNSYNRVFQVSTLAINLFLIFETKSIQGLGLFLIGIVSSLLYSFHIIKRIRVSSNVLTVFVCAVVITIALLFANSSIMRLLNSQETLVFRWHYWNAGIKMAMENPVFGVGFDAYGDWYRNARSEAAISFIGSSVITNAAHNVFVDLLASGGFVLFFAYFSMQILVLRSGLRILKRRKEFEGPAVGLVFCWISYLVQSCFSINQIGLAIWGWLLAGVILGIDFNQQRLNKNAIAQTQFSSLSVLMGVLIGIVIAGPLIQKDHNYLRALEAGVAEDIEQRTLQFPLNTYYFQTTSTILAYNKLYERELVILQRAVEFNKRDFLSWQRIEKNQESSVHLKKLALKELGNLDPNPNG